MKLLEVSHVKKVYTTRFGGSTGDGAAGCELRCGAGRVCRGDGRERIGKDDAAQYPGGARQARRKEKCCSTDRISCVFLNGRWRRSAAEHLGFVFQDFNLLDSFSLKDNIFLPLVLSGMKYEEMNRRLQPIAKELGIYGAAAEVSL